MIAVRVKNGGFNLLNCLIRSEKLLLISLVLVSFLVRIFLMTYFHTYQFPDERSMGYEMGWIAWNLVHGEGFKVGHYYAWMAPLYPFILSLVFRIFGSYTISSAIVTLVIQSSISSLVVIPLYFIGKKLFSKRIGFITALLWVFHPDSIFYAIKFVWSSSLTSLELALMVLIVLRLAEKPVRNFDALLGGLVIGLAALSDPVILTFVPFSVLWLLWRSPNGLKRSIGLLAVLAITVIVLLIPWTLRNYRILHQFVPIKSTFGVNLWQGNHGLGIDQRTAGLNFDYELEASYSPTELAYLLSLNEVERDKVLRDRAVEFILSNPKTFAKYTLQRIYLFWRLTIRNPGTLFDRMLLALIPFTWLGIILSWRRWRDIMPILLLFVSYPLIFYVTHADFNRFRFPLEEMMLVFVAYSIWYFIRLAGLERVILAIKSSKLAPKRVKW